MSNANGSEAAIRNARADSLIEAADRNSNGETRQYVKIPPHDDQIEAALEAEIAAVLKKQGAYAAERIRLLTTELDALQRICDYTSQKADIALRAHTKTLIAVRVQTDHLREVVEELSEGHADLAEFLRKPRQ